MRNLLPNPAQRLTASMPAVRRGNSPFLFIFFGAGFFLACGGLQLQIAGLNTRGLTDPAASSVLSQVLLSAFYFGAMILFFCSPKAMSVLRRSWPILVLPLLAIISTAWSPDPGLTFRRSVAFLGTVLFGLSLATRLSFGNSLRLITQVLALSMLLSAIWVMIFPEGVHQATDSASFQSVHAGLWRGIFAHRNILGILSGLTLALVVVYGRFVFGNWALRGGTLAVSLACLIGALSGSGFVVATLLLVILFLASFLGQLHPYERAQTFLTLLLLTIFCTFVFGNIINETVLSLLGKDPDLTGRTIYWELMLQAIRQSLPTFGYGYYSGFAFEIAPRIASLMGGRMPEAHNGYLEILVAFGYGGLAIFISVILWLWWSAVRFFVIGQSNTAVFMALPLGLITVFIALNFVESTLMMPHSISVVLVGWCVPYITAPTPSSAGKSIATERSQPDSSAGRLC